MLELISSLGDAVTLVLPRAKTISGTIVDESGRVVPAGVPVLCVAQGVSLQDNPGSSAFTYARAQGRFSVEGLGDFTFRVVAGGGPSEYASAGKAQMVAGGTGEVVLKVRKGGTISGRLLDADGNPVKTPFLGGSSRNHHTSINAKNDKRRTIS